MTVSDTWLAHLWQVFLAQRVHTDPGLGKKKWYDSCPQPTEFALLIFLGRRGPFIVSGVSAKRYLFQADINSWHGDCHFVISSDACARDLINCVCATLPSG